MKPKLGKKCFRCVVSKAVAGCLFGCNKQERVARQLDVLIRENAARQENAIEEQIRQCPDALKVGELMEKLFQEIKHGFEGDVEQDRCLPPPESIIPPF